MNVACLHEWNVVQSSYYSFVYMFTHSKTIRIKIYEKLTTKLVKLVEKPLIYVEPRMHDSFSESCNSNHSECEGGI